MTIKYTQTDIESAAIICSILACSNEANPADAIDDAVQSVGGSFHAEHLACETSLYVSILRYRYHEHEARSSGAARWAEAEALIRSGWLPYWAR